MNMFTCKYSTSTVMMLLLEFSDRLHYEAPFRRVMFKIHLISSAHFNDDKVASLTFEIICGVDRDTSMGFR